jgi:pimeloyl-ACP methyl ester carboxylesterase
MTPHPVLMLGGYGSLGARTTRILRYLHPDLPIVIVGRDTTKATALAREVGNATIDQIDLSRADLGLPPTNDYSLVVTALRDLSLNTLRFAQARGIPYMAVSDGTFETGPLVARFIHYPLAAPVVMIGHSMGAVPTLAALYFAREFEQLERIELGLVFDPGDPLGPASLVDMERINKIGPAPLMLEQRRWQWTSGPKRMRHFTGVGGFEVQGQAVGLMDVLSLSSLLVHSVRVDVAEAPTASTRRGDSPSHEVIIEIVGTHKDGKIGRFRYELIDPRGYAALSAVGMSVVIEHLLGLTGAPAPRPELYLPEMIVDLEHLMGRVKEFGVQVNVL